MARNRAIGVTLGILLLLVLAVAISRALSALGSRSDTEAGAAPTTLATPATDPPAASPTTAPDTTTPTASPARDNLVRNPGFETGAGGWRPIGAGRIDLVDVAHEGSWGLKLSGGSAPNPGVAYPTVAITKAKGSMYQGSVWVRASRPGQTGEVRLLEYVKGQRFAIFRAGLVLGDTGWHRLQVAQLVHVQGSTLALEVVAPKLPANANLTVDDVNVHLARAE
jgi:hypothetical protein